MAIPDDYNTGVLGEVFEATQAAIAAALLMSGVTMLVLGIISGTTGVLTGWFDMSVYGSWRVAGILGGIGFPLIIVGVFTVLPATNAQRLGAAVGLVFVVIGMLLFAISFPDQWYGDETDRTFLVASIYFIGMLLTVVYLFLAVANLQTPTASDQSRSQHTVSYKRRNQNPQTATELVRGVIGLLRGHGADDGGDADDVDLGEVCDALEDTLGDSIESTEINNGHVIVERAEDENHARFTTRLPKYVKVVKRDEQMYVLDVDGFTFQMLQSATHE